MTAADPAPRRLGICRDCGRIEYLDPHHRCLDCHEAQERRYVAATAVDDDGWAEPRPAASEPRSGGNEANPET